MPRPLSPSTRLHPVAPYSVPLRLAPSCPTPCRPVPCRTSSPHLALPRPVLCLSTLPGATARSSPRRRYIEEPLPVSTSSSFVIFVSTLL
ncbi:hypothetical protein ABZP36_010271 [Zizania latifolia]